MVCTDMFVRLAPALSGSLATDAVFLFLTMSDAASLMVAAVSARIPNCLKIIARQFRIMGSPACRWNPVPPPRSLPDEHQARYTFRRSRGCSFRKLWCSALTTYSSGAPFYNAFTLVENRNEKNTIGLAHRYVCWIYRCVSLQCRTPGHIRCVQQAGRLSASIWGNLARGVSCALFWV